MFSARYELFAYYLYNSRIKKSATNREDGGFSNPEIDFKHTSAGKKR